MRPELGFDALSTKRLVVGTVTTIVGAVMFLVGLLARPGGTPGLIALAGGGALLLFLGTASVSSTVAKPVTKLIGWPVAKVYKAPGQLASENAGRAPTAHVGDGRRADDRRRPRQRRRRVRRVAAQHVRRRRWTAASPPTGWSPPTGSPLLPDVVVRDARRRPRAVGRDRRARPCRCVIDGDEKQVGAADPVALEQLINVGLESRGLGGAAGGRHLRPQGSGQGPRPRGRLDRRGDVPERRRARAAGRRHLQRRLPRRQLADVLDGASTRSSPASRATSSSALKTADGVSEDDARQAIEDALVDYPQAKIETADQFKDSQAEQIDQLLVIITVLLAFAIIIAVLGISITLGLAVFERTREIGLMRAVGMTKRQTRRMVRWEAIIVSTFGAIVGIVLGTLIGIALSLAVPDTIIDGISFSTVDDHRHPHRRRPRRLHRRPLPVVQGVAAWTSSRRSPPSEPPHRPMGVQRDGYRSLRSPIGCVQPAVSQGCRRRGTPWRPGAGRSAGRRRRAQPGRGGSGSRGTSRGSGRACRAGGRAPCRRSGSSPDRCARRRRDRRGRPGRATCSAWARLARSSRAATLTMRRASASPRSPTGANGCSSHAHSTSLRYTLPTPQNTRWSRSTSPIGARRSS